MGRALTLRPFGPSLGACVADPLLEAALALAGAGVRVFPLSPGTKFPAIPKREGGKGLLDATVDETQIRAWWDEYPGANVGVATGEGSGVVVLDVDVRAGKVGARSLEELEARHGELPATYTVRTTSGGYHLYYRAVPGLRSTASVLGKDLDTRAEGGYVVAPPSVLDGSSPKDVAGAYEVVDPSPVALLPEWLAALWPRAGAAKPRAVVPVPVYNGPIDLGELRKLLGELRVSKSRSIDKDEQERHAVLARVLDGEPLAPLGARTRALLSITGMMARKFPAGMPAEAAIEVLRASVVAMPMDPNDPESERLVDYWLGKAKLRYQAAMRDRVAADAEWEAKRAFLRLARERAAKDGGVEDWTALLQRDKHGVVLNRPYNLKTILSHDDDLLGFVRWNELKRRVDVVGGPFRERPFALLPMDITVWLDQKYEVNAKVATVGEHLMCVARDNPYNPVADYLRSIEWDGVPRIGHGETDTSWLERYCGAVTDVAGEDATEHVRRVAWKSLVAAVARAHEPGCQVDTMLILEGPQGTRKSTAFRILAGDFVRVADLSTVDRDAKMLIGAAWIVEFGELDGISKVEAARLKSFITTPTDSYRTPYGRDSEDWQRRCIFVGTTNDAEYLQDPTGMRRFWPVAVTQIDAAALERDRDALWAEATRVYEMHVAWTLANPGEHPDGSPHRWWLVGAECEPAEHAAQLRSVDDGALDKKVLEWWASRVPAARPEYLTAYEVAEQALELDASRINRAILTRVGVAMRKLGFVRRRFYVVDRQVWAYFPNDTLKGMSHRIANLEVLRSVK